MQTWMRGRYTYLMAANGPQVVLVLLVISFTYVTLFCSAWQQRDPEDSGELEIN